MGGEAGADKVGDKLKQTLRGVLSPMPGLISQPGDQDLG